MIMTYPTLHRPKRAVAWIAAAALACSLVPAAAFADAPASADEQPPAANTELTLVSQAAKGKNSTGKANTKKLFGYKKGQVGYYESTSLSGTVSSYDVTGDSVADTLQVTVTPVDPQNPDDAEAISFYVNGKEALRLDTLNGKTKQSLSPQFKASLATLANKKPYLLVQYADPMWSSPICKLFRYKSGKFVSVLSNQSFGSKAGMQQYSFSVKPHGNSMDVTYLGLSSFVKWVRITMPYTYNKATGLKLKSSTAKKVVYEYFTDGKIGARPGSEGAKFGTGKLTPVKAFKVYKSISLKKAAFTAKKGSKVKITGATVKGGKIFFKVKSLSNGKVGWVNAKKSLLDYDAYSTTRWFREVSI